MELCKMLALTVIVFVRVAGGEAQNSTAPASGSSVMKNGWQNGPNQRGTITIIWSCLSTILACTWTILHLNVPGHEDGLLIRIRRKAKWMLITILFPEFIFSKAICELQMAVDDLYSMKQMGNTVCWDVEFSRKLEILHGMLHLIRKPFMPRETAYEESNLIAPASRCAPKVKTVTHPSVQVFDSELLQGKRRTWTLTHSYFANMGGFERYKDLDVMPLTANALVHCCIGKDHDPLPTLSLQKEDIEDKSKADWFVKAVAVAQISWLILSVIVRAQKRMPISQIEICTVAFAVLAVLTYLANLSKPKDIGTPVRFRVVRDTYNCEAAKFTGTPIFHRRMLAPSENFNPVGISRIKNDFVRLEGYIPPMAINMSIATIIFGGLHCLAWYFHFPTNAELGIWMGTAVASATIPTVALMINTVAAWSIDRANLNCWKAFNEPEEVSRQEMRSYIQHTLRSTNQELPESQQHVNNHWIGLITNSSLIKDLDLLKTDLSTSIRSQFRDQVFFSTYKDFITRWEPYIHLHLTSESFEATVKVEQVPQTIGARPKDDKDLELLYALINIKKFVLDQEHKLNETARLWKRVSTFCFIIAGILYAAVRLTLLALAFAALRSMPEGVFTSTWTRYLPNIS